MSTGTRHRRPLAGALGLCLVLAGCNRHHATEAAAATPTPAPSPSFAKGRASGVPATAGVIVQDGDSIGAGQGADGNWAAIEHLGLPPGVKIHNASVNGQWMMTGLGQRAQDVFPFYDKAHASVLVIQQGTNDLVGGDTADYLYQNVTRPFVQLSQKAGFYVAVDTILPRSDPGWTADPVHEQQRQAYNKLVRANSIGADAVIDLAADPVIGDGVNTAISMLYFDGLHLRKAGQQRIAKIEAKPLATMLQYQPRAPTP